MGVFAFFPFFFFLFLSVRPPPQFLIQFSCFGFHKQGLSFTNVQYLSSLFRTGKPVELTTMRVKAVAFFLWLGKKSTADSQGPEKWPVKIVAMLSVRWLSSSLRLKFYISSIHPPHTFVSVFNQTVSAFA